MNHESRVRDMERAAVNRWFPDSPFGTMFSAGRGRMLPISIDAIQSWRDEAYAIIDKFIVDSRPPSQWAMMAVILAFFFAMLALQPYLGLEAGQIGGIIMGGVLLWHVDDVWRLWCYRRDLRELRARIAASLVLRTPVPEELAKRYARGNPWRIALHVWVVGLTAFLLLSMHFMPVETIDTVVFLATLGAIGIAWIFYFLARRVDLA